MLWENTLEGLAVPPWQESSTQSHRKRRADRRLRYRMSGRRIVGKTGNTLLRGCDRCNQGF